MYPFPPCLFRCTACLASCRSCASLTNHCGVAALHDTVRPSCAFEIIFIIIVR
ncbi:hypothetical protein M752DRAFT_276206 [Aspergillus phoenicis ATCC 13157]|uniref:Uncharacterized protein n=1 Tax=Aspergillus phoenicis ATCC 13157 TaxID=1353007 RepID=A0A370PLR3_ASPPH|nr:hypothetical protein M752DRAFT_276206 [Aspergillus phoenicis ATCC 13157]